MSIAIIGCGGHARSIADTILHNNEEKLCFFDDAAEENEFIFKKYPVYKMDELNDDFDEYFIAIGDNIRRKELYEEGIIDLTRAKTVIHKDSYQGVNSEVLSGSAILSGAHIGADARIGRGCIINTNAVIEHEVWIGDYSHVSVNATICGRARIGNCVFIGAGAVVIDKVKICDDVIVGAGAVVTSNITEKGTYIGVPARMLVE
ncbi:acetyltransferase [Lachnospiraceae bacterium C1.1]|nr:acetyltransferase [Lachnospiraceae bacterium C1.1]